MPRLFIRHEPVDCLVEESINSSMFYLPKHTFNRFGLSAQDGPNNPDVAYVCIVNNGKCFAARRIEIMGNKQQRITCVSFDDDPCGQQMVLADMILQ